LTAKPATVFPEIVYVKAEFPIWLLRSKVWFI